MRTTAAPDVVVSDPPAPSEPTIVVPVDETALTGDELRQKLRMNQHTFYRYQSLGKFERFQLRPQIGSRLYSRKLVQAYLDREDTRETRSGGVNPK